MIITCPECATSYFVDDARVPPQGRMVKCSSCGARWRATLEGETTAEPELAPPPPGVEGVAPEPEPPAPEPDDLEITAAPVVPRRKPETKAKNKAKPRGLIVAAALGAVVIAALGGAVVMRQQVAGAIPGAASIFAAIGLPVDALGLVIEGVTSKAVLEAGRPALSVTGAIRNTRHEAAEAPPIRISLLDRDGKVVAGVIADPQNGKVPPGGVRYFAVSLPNPPAGAHELEIGFDLTAKHAAPAPVAPAPAAAPPAEAQPLPAGSPDALEKHDPH